MLCLATLIMILYKKKWILYSRNSDAYYKRRGKTSARDQFPGNKGILNNICPRCLQCIPITYWPVARVARFGFMDVHYERADI